MTVASGAKITSSWSWSPLEPRFSSSAFTSNGTPLTWIICPTGLVPLVKRRSATVRPIAATLARAASSASLNQWPSRIWRFRISPNTASAPMNDPRL